jgi:putative phosphoesterase
VRVAIVSDTHMPRGIRRLPDRCAEELRAADAIVHCGDFMTAEVVREFRSFGPPLHAVHGNVDTAEVRAVLPERTTVTLEGVTLGLVHIPGPSPGRLERLRASFPGCHAVLFGHTHVPEHETRDGFQIFNPGSPTERRRAPRHTMGIATIEGERVEFRLLTVA